MPITTADIKLMASARMNDDPDGGGRMAGVALQDGADNNMFPDLSSLNRAQGVLQFRKVFPSVQAAGADTLLGTHIILDDTPDDPDVFSVLVPANGDAQEQAALATTLNALNEAYGYCGQTTLTAVAAVDATTLSVAGQRVPLIPKVETSAAASGALASEDVAPTVTAWEPSGQTVSLITSGDSLVPATPIGTGRIKPGSVSGTWNGGAQAVTSTRDGAVTFAGAGGSSYAQNVAGEYPATYYARASGPVPTGLAVTGEIMVPVQLPRRELKFSEVPGQVVYTLAVPAATALASLTVRHLYYEGALVFGVTGTTLDGKETMPAPSYPLSYAGARVTFASLDRAAGVLTLVFQSALSSGEQITVTFAEGGQTIPIETSDLAGGGVLTAGALAITIDAGRVFGAAVFSLGGGSFRTSLGGVISDSANVTRGAVNASGALAMPGYTGTITNWFGVQNTASPSVSAFAGTLVTGLQPTTLIVTGTTAGATPFTATANSAGVFSTAPVAGTYNALTGAINLTFSTPVSLNSLAYSATQTVPLPSTADLQGLNEASFAADGTVPVFRLGSVVVLHNSVDVAAANYVNGNTVDCARVNLASVRVIGTDGASILTGWTVNLTTGIVSITNVAGWAQPVVVRHTVEHIAVVTGLPTPLSVTINRKLTRSFASGSRLSSAVVLGDLAASANAAFSQSTWTDVWSDVRIGGAIAAQYQQLANPIGMTNPGAANERWAIIFTSSTAFRLVGETLGQITTGTVNDPLAPLNPATSQPYFTLAATGWGGGWAAGNVLRFNTRGANSPIWVARVVRPSAPSSATDSLTVAIRGDINT